MLQNFVAPVIILAASLWTASSCFLLSAVALSQTASLYSSRGLIKEMYIFPRACLLILNLSARSRLSCSSGCCNVVNMFILIAVVSKVGLNVYVKKFQ